MIAEVGTTNKPLKARISTKSEMTTAGCTENSGSCPSWLTSNLDGTNVKGYWLLTFAYMEDRGSYVRIWVNGVTSEGRISQEDYDNDKINGVRPVITIPISELS